MLDLCPHGPVALGACMGIVSVILPRLSAGVDPRAGGKCRLYVHIEHNSIKALVPKRDGKNHVKEQVRKERKNGFSKTQRWVMYIICRYLNVALLATTVLPACSVCIGRHGTHTGGSSCLPVPPQNKMLRAAHTNKPVIRVGCACKNKKQRSSVLIAFTVQLSCVKVATTLLAVQRMCV